MPLLIFVLLSQFCLAIGDTNVNPNGREWVGGSNVMAWRAQNIFTEKMRNYDKHRRPYPNGTGSPVIITTSLTISSIGSVNEKNMEFKVQFRFQQEWFDERLRYDDRSFREFEFMYLPTDPHQEIWLPDTFFQNEKAGEIHWVDQENVAIKVRADGKVIYNRRLSMTFLCVLNLLRYPLDVQTCLIDFASYAYTTDDILYEWDGRPLQFHPDATSSLPNFFLIDRYNASCTSVTNTGTYSCLRVVLKLKRVFSYFLLQMYVPSSLLVAVSWVSYWIDWRATAGRVPLAIITLLTMITQSHIINANLPPVAYTKAIDVWIGACVIFVFGSLIEYALVNYTGIQEQRGGMLTTAHTDSIWDVLAGKARMEKRRRISDQLFQNDSILAAHIQSSKETLLRRRPSDVDGMELGLRGSSRRKALPDTEQPYLGGAAVHFEDISSNLDWIRLRTRRRVELLQWCRIFKQRGRAERIDFVSRMLFPMAFAMFNVAYWSVYWNWS